MSSKRGERFWELNPSSPKSWAFWLTVTIALALAVTITFASVDDRDEKYPVGGYSPEEVDYNRPIDDSDLD